MRPRVSDHALVRFIARAGGLDVESLRAAIAASLERAAGAAVEMGQHSYTVNADGLRYVIRAGVVVTIEPLQIGRAPMQPEPKEANRR